MPATVIPPQSHRRAFVVATIAAVLMAFLGALGTDAIAFPPRLAYWLIVMEAGALIGVGASTGVRTWGRLAAHPVAEGAAISLLIALPLTLLVSGTTALFFGPQRMGLPGAGVMFVSVFVITAAITAITYLTARAAMPIAASPAVDPPAESAWAPPLRSPAPSSPPPPSRLLDRLPLHIRAGDLIALEAEDHYVRVHTTSGSALVLLRMGDAVAELDGIDGLRTHRSWWVARAAVVEARRSDGRGEVTLAGGLVVPVSRSALPELARAGWFG